ncbi:xanthine dehydrogenase family protein molybdopterin-binding subunit [Pseudonocardia thermophila]|nr:xanthine dehydrogenase family protein molybdopterin-binding subunit [Pseudonocardia thermophila]
MPDARDRVRGTLPMTVHLHLSGMLHAAVVRSPVAHGELRGVDATAAHAVPGVVAVLTAVDLPGPVPHFGDATDDQPVLATDRVRYAGEPVALVVAEDEHAAAAAAAAVELDVDVLPHVTDADEALAPEAPLVHPGGNVLRAWTLRHGDPEAALATADRVYDDVYESPPAAHVPMEPHVAAAEWTDEALTVWTSTQSPHVVRETLAAAFALPVEHVRVCALNVGGAYGAKVVTTIEPLAALAARHVGRPVRLRLDRAEVFHTLVKHAARVRIRTGVRNDGRIVARLIDVVWNAGAYATNSESAAGYGMLRAPGPYDVPNVAVTSTAVFTNTVPAGPFRGAMTSQLCWAYESQMDDIAADLGIDPVRLREINLLRDGSVYPTGEVMHDLHYDELLAVLRRELAAIDVEPVRPGHARGQGLALMIKSTLTPSHSECRLRACADGTYELHTASVEIGQGAHATLRALAAAELGTTPERVVVYQPDTAEAPYDSMTASSRTTFAMGSAVQDAARQVRQALAAGRTPPFEVIGSWTGDGGLDALDEHGQGPASTHWHQGGVAVEVDVDLETGRITVVRAAGACYAGRVVSPVRVAHQNEGGMIFALGPALFEELGLRDGLITNPNLSDYSLPSFRDVPRMRSAAVEAPGADLHGVGEMTVPPTAPAIGNAVRAACGVRLRRLPMHPERVLRAILERAEEVPA